MKRQPERLADPYRDLDVIDSRAPRFNQVVIGTLALLAVVAGWPWLVGLLALQLVVGLTFGRRYCLPCLAYFELVQPVFGEGRSRTRGRRASRTWWGSPSWPRRSSRTSPVPAFLGATLALLVAALALLAGASGFCAGCEAYKLGYVLTGRRFVACPLPPRPQTLSQKP